MNHHKINRIIFNELFRHDIAALLGFEANDNAPGTNKKRMAFLKQIDWDNPKITDQIVRFYITRVATLVQENLKESIPLTVSFGAPDTDEKDRIVRPQLYIRVVEDKDNPDDRSKEHYQITYTPAQKEEGSSDRTNRFLRALRRTLERDLHITLDPPSPHPTSKLPENIKMKQFFTIRNLYTDEGINMDMTIPGDELLDRLKKIISQGEREVSKRHIPGWSHSP